LRYQTLAGMLRFCNPLANCNAYSLNRAWVVRRRHCAFVSSAVGSELMAKQRVHKNENKGFEGGQYARTEVELYKKAVMLLDKCKIEPRS
jgi:hypothetical protein